MLSAKSPAKWSVQIAGVGFQTGSHVTKAKGGQNERSDLIKQEKSINFSITAVPVRWFLMISARF